MLLTWGVWKIRVCCLKRSRILNGRMSSQIRSEPNVTTNGLRNEDDYNSKKVKDGKEDEVIPNLREKMVQTFTILMLLAYPNIMQFLFYTFKCIDIDGEMRLKADLEILCWSSSHKVFAFMIALPGLIVWGLGLPILSFWYLTQNRAKIIKADDMKVKIS